MINPTKKLTALFIFFILFFTLFNQVFSYNTLAQQNTEDDEENDDSPLLGPIGLLFKFLGKSATALAPIFRLSVVAVVADPPCIEIGYGETKTIELGLWDTVTNDDFEVWSEEHTIFVKRFINFEVRQYPKGTQENSWLVVPDPYTINVEVGSELKTNLSITLNKPPISGEPIQSGILRIRVLDTWAYGSLYFPPRGGPRDTPTGNLLWFISATLLMGFGKYSGTVDVEYKDVDILVKVKPYHAVRFNANPLVYVKPNEITSIPITLQNLGNYNDTFGFRIQSKNNNIKLASPSYITLAPGEEKQTYLGVSALRSAFDYGTVHEVVIETFSVDDEDVVISEKNVFIETRGIYVSETGGMGIFLLIFVLFLIVVYLINRRRRRLNKYCVKPDKPWEIAEEKEYLDKLAKEDKDKHKEVLKMMEEEYESSLLWYKNYCKKITEPKPKPVKKKKVKKDKFKKEKTKKEITTKSEKEPIVEEKIEEKPSKEPVVEEADEVKVDKKENTVDLGKQKLLAQIKKKEEKQKRKLKK